MQVGSKKLFDVLLEFNRYLASELGAIAVGGTALTLLGKKESTKDIDLCFEDEQGKKRFIRTAERLGYTHESDRLIGHGIIIDVYSNGFIFCVQLPPDYRGKTVQIRNMGKLSISALSPEDLIITKTARLNERDTEDIEGIFKDFVIDREGLVSRYMSVMENSVVRDAKSNLVWLAERFGFPGALREKISRWGYG